MKYKKRIFLILIVAFLLFGLGTLAAADVTKNDTSVTKSADVTKTGTVSKDSTSASKVQATQKNDDNNKIVETKTNTKTNKITDKTIKKTDITKNVKTAGSYTQDVDNYNELVSAVETAKTSTYDEYTINLKDGDYTATREIIWGNSQNTKTLIIEGNDNILNGNNQEFRFITIAKDHNLKINNIIIQNYTYTSDEDDVEYYGGAIQNNGNLTITNTIIKNNHINLTGTGSSSYGGAINNNGTLTIKDSNLTHNNANKGGSISNYYGGILNIRNSNLEHNNATYGGAIFNYESTINITNTNITHNTAERYGGAINNYGGTLNINNSNLNYNNATLADGGAIANTQSSTINITDSNLEHNTANQEGGAIFNHGNIIIISSELNYNNATSGGAISNPQSYSNLIIRNSNLTYNTVTSSGTYAGGGAIFNYGKLNITDSNLDYNNAPNGGAIKNQGTINKIENTKFSYNTPLNFIIEDNKIKLNRTDNFISIDKFTLITDDREHHGTGTESLASYTIPSDSKLVKLILNGTDTKTVDNTFILKEPKEINITGYQALVAAIEEAKRNAYSTYKINLLPGNYTATQSIVWEDSATREIIINGNNHTLNGNKTYQFINIAEEHNLTLENITISNYTATDGGAIYNNGTLNINNTNITGNNASSWGGAIYSNGTLNINNTNFEYNIATSGGAIYSRGSNSSIFNSVLNNNEANYGGAIQNVRKLTVQNSTLKNNTATGGGAILNAEYISNLIIVNSNITKNTAKQNGGAIQNFGTLNITCSNITGNNATNWGGAISYHTFSSTEYPIILFNSTLTENKAAHGAVIYNNNGYGNYTITYNTFKNNTATDDRETLNLGNYIKEKTIEENTYDNTDINLKTINLTTQKTKYQYNDDIILNYTIQLTNNEFYDLDILDKINKTLYIDTIENSTTKEKNYTLSKLKAGHHTVLYKTCNSESNNLTLTVTGDSEIKTDKTTYDHVDGIKNKITLDVTDPSGEKGTINITVKDQDEYKEISSYSNVGNGYQLSTDALVEALENLYTNLGESYTINISYTSDSEYVNSSSTEFTLNIIQKRNTTITYKIINNTEGNVQINVTVLDAIYKTPIPDAQIIITGALMNETSAGIITDNTLTPGKYNITVKYNGTEDYNKSNTTIDFTVEIDKDAKITELENNITNLTQDLKDAQEEIQNLTETNNQLEQQLSTLLKTLEDLNTTINNLTQQLENAQQEIQDLNNTITELNKTIDTTINIKPVTSSVGSQVNLTATITDEIGNKVTTGKVLFKVNGITLKDANGNVIYAIVNNGEATLTTKTQAAWIKNNTNIQAVYSGEKPYKSSRANTTNITLTKGKATITLDKPTITAKAGQTITLKAKVLDSNGDRINNDKVVFKLNGRTLTDKDGKTLYARVVDGEAVLEYTIPETYNAKTYNLTAVFGGNYYERTQTQGTLILEKKATTITTENITTTDGKTTIKATIRDETGKTLTSTTKVAIKINGKTITTTNSTNGTIDTSFTTTLKPGTYELTIISGENGQYKKATMTTVLKI